MRRRDEHRDRNKHRHDARIDPQVLPRHGSVDQRRGNQSSRRLAEHPDALGDSNGGCEISRRKTMGREVHRRDKCKRGASTLHKPPDTRYSLEPSPNSAVPSARSKTPTGIVYFRAPAIHRHASNDREHRIGIVVKTEEGTYADSRQPEASREFGNMTLGADRTAYSMK